MNVYTNVSYRRQGVARMLVQMLINEAKEKRVTEISLEFDCKDYMISDFEVVEENNDFIQVHYMITTTVNEEANKDLAGTFHISTTWKRFGNAFKVVFNMDSVAHIS